MEDYLEGTQETWNMAQAYLYRLDTILTRCMEARDNENPHKWFKALDNLYMEVRSKLKPSYRKEAGKMYNDLKRFYQTNYRANKVKMQIFYDFEFYLRDCIDELGLLTPKNKDPHKLI